MGPCSKFIPAVIAHFLIGLSVRSPSGQQAFMIRDTGWTSKRCSTETTYTNLPKIQENQTVAIAKKSNSPEKQRLQ
jgi:hypothetical protein